MDPRHLFFALCVAAAPAWADVTVTHSDPTRFTDIEDRSSEPEPTMRELKAHLEDLGKRYSPGKNVRVEVLDVDRAGRPHHRNEVRVMTGKSDFPCIDLASGLDGASMTRERVCDLNYLRTSAFPNHSGEALVFEKRMLDDWFRRRFGDKR